MSISVYLDHWTGALAIRSQCHGLTHPSTPLTLHPLTPDRTHHQRRDVHRAARTRVRGKDLDQIEKDLQPQNRAKLEKQEINEDLPGLGQHVRRSLSV